MFFWLTQKKTSIKVISWTWYFIFFNWSEGNPIARAATPVEATPLPPPVSTKRTEGGYVEWNNLQLSPPPPLYRPFVAMDEEKKSTKKTSLKEKFGQYRFSFTCHFSVFSS